MEQTNVPLTFRPATSKDLPALSALVNSAYRGDSSRQGWTTEADLLGGQRTDPEALGAMLTEQSQILLAWEKDILIGCVYLKQETSGWVYLGMLTVSPARQNTGLGKKLLAAAHDWAHGQIGVQGIRMTVISIREELIAWYERHGFRRTGETEPFPYGDSRFGLPKRADLKFCVLTKSFR